MSIYKMVILYMIEQITSLIRPQPQRLGAYRFGVSVRLSVRLSVCHRFFSRLYLCNEWSNGNDSNEWPNLAKMAKSGFSKHELSRLYLSN